MRLELVRLYKKKEYTIGKLYIDGVYFCDTLEDPVRDLPIEEKIGGHTAIPEGTYRIVLHTISPKYSQKKAYDWCGGRLPRLLNVPYFDGILIHSGNTNKDTAGCILVGENKEKGKVLNSMATLKRLYKKMKEKEDEGISIIIH
jgi:hypothetical protein